MVKKIYCYYDKNDVILSHDKPSSGIAFIEKIISNIGIPEARAVSIKTQDGTLLYNNIEYIPLDDNSVENYLKEVIHK